MSKNVIDIVANELNNVIVIKDDYIEHYSTQPKSRIKYTNHFNNDQDQNQNQDKTITNKPKNNNDNDNSNDKSNDKNNDKTNNS